MAGKGIKTLIETTPKNFPEAQKFSRKLIYEGNKTLKELGFANHTVWDLEREFYTPNCQLATSHNSFGISKQHSPSPQPIVTTTSQCITGYGFNNLKVQGLKLKMGNILSLLSCCPVTKNIMARELSNSATYPWTFATIHKEDLKNLTSGPNTDMAIITLNACLTLL